MIKPRSIIARIGVGLAIVAGLSMGAPAASFAQEEFDTSQVSSISQSADAGSATCKNNEDRDFAFQCSGTSATGYRQKEDSSSVYILGAIGMGPGTVARLHPIDGRMMTFE